MAGGQDPRFLEGLRLYRRGRYFEAHEAWEALWHEVRGPEREPLQGLIQAAVCLHHATKGNARGAKWLYGRCARRLAGRKELWGLACGPFLAGLRRRLTLCQT